MKKIFTLLAVAAMAVSANAQGMSQPIVTGDLKTDVLYHASGDKKNILNNEDLGVDEGWEMQCLNLEKTLDPGSASFSIVPLGISDCKSIKFSNGAQHRIKLPEGRYAVYVDIICTINYDVNADKNKDKTPRDCYWKECAGVNYEAPLAEGATAEEGKKYADHLITSLLDPTNFDMQRLNIPNLNEFTLTNTGEQPMVVLRVSHVNIPPVESSLVEIAADENAPVEYFNLQGVRVENPANGLFIRKQGSKVTKVIL